jgi:hypothetical protein
VTTAPTPRTWHADPDDLAGYAAGTAPAVLADSLEAHLLRCADCRASLGRAGAATETDRRWERLADAVDRPTPTLTERLGLRRGTGRGLYRVALAAPAMRWAAAAAVALVVGLPLLAALGAGGRALVLLLALAPAAPAGATALAYRHVADPAGELALATPRAGLGLVAARAVVVAAGAVPTGLVAGVATGVPAHLALGWLLPGLALSAVVLLAGTTRADPLVVAGGLCAAWALGVWLLALEHAAVPVGLRVAEAVADPAVQLAALALLALASLSTLARRDAVAYRRTA